MLLTQEQILKLSAACDMMAGTAEFYKMSQAVVFNQDRQNVLVFNTPNKSWTSEESYKFDHAFYGPGGHIIEIRSRQFREFKRWIGEEGNSEFRPATLATFLAAVNFKDMMLMSVVIAITAGEYAFNSPMGSINS